MIYNAPKSIKNQMTQPTVSQHWRMMVSQPHRGPISQGWAY